MECASRVIPKVCFHEVMQCVSSGSAPTLVLALNLTSVWWLRLDGRLVFFGGVGFSGVGCFEHLLSLLGVDGGEPDS